MPVQNPPNGCYFHPLCSYALEICRQEVSAWTEDTPGHFVACHRSRELALAGAPRIDQPYKIPLSVQQDYLLTSRCFLKQLETGEQNKI